MRTLNKIKIAIAALFVGLLCSSPLASLAQNENGVTDQGESTTKVNSSYVNENGKFVCWPRVTSYGKLLKYPLSLPLTVRTTSPEPQPPCTAMYCTMVGAVLPWRVLR